MTNPRFLVLLGCAFVVALPLSVIFGMPHCQQLIDTAAAEECFQRNARGSWLYWGCIGTFTLTSIALHLSRNKWTGLALAGLAIGPWLTVYLA